MITLTNMNTQPKTGFARLLAGTRAQSDEAAKRSMCKIDPTERRLVDFQLPRIDGKWGSLREFEADVILLDFWGSWCAPCGASIAHLIELQSTLADKRFQVIGIACETGKSPADRQANAAKAIKDLGINYPVLVSSKGGSCPVQQSLQVQFYPTMILLDRDGRILAMERGATDATLSRMDRGSPRPFKIATRSEGIEAIPPRRSAPRQS